MTPSTYKGELVRVQDQLSTIETKINFIVRMVIHLAVDQEALDAAITDVGQHAADLEAQLTALIAKIEASGVPTDFTEEVAALQATSAGLQTATEAANAALAPEPPAPPTP